jgi:hypothetical protein
VARGKKLAVRFAPLFLLLLLLHPQALSMRASPLPTGPVVYPLYLSPGYYEYFPVDAFTNGTVVEYSMSSNASVSTALMTAAQFQDFNSSNGPVSNSIAYQNGTSARDTLRVNPGIYNVLVYAYGSSANVTLSVAIYPNNPLAYGQLQAPQPSGIASYGLTNASGTDNPYAVASTDVVGLASISSLEALNSSAGSVGANPSGATLQLNSMLVVDEGSGSQVYWCQNTPDFVTSASQISFSDNVWNASVSGFLSNDSITSQGGGGYVSTYDQKGTVQYFYAYGDSNATYTLPLGLTLLMNATAEPGTGVLVQFGARSTEDLYGAGTGAVWFDNVTVHDPGATSAYFATDGNYSTPIGTFYDTEFVFGGEGNGETTSFTSLGASLGLYYANGTSPSLSAFPSYFSFGQDTAEAADNLRVSYLGDGGASVSVGTPNYEYLGAASGEYSFRSAEGLLGFPGFTNGTSTTLSTITTSTTLTSQSTASTLSGIPEYPYQAAAVTALVAVVAVAYLAVRGRARLEESRR